MNLYLQCVLDMANAHVRVRSLACLRMQICCYLYVECVRAWGARARAGPDVGCARVVWCAQGHTAGPVGACWHPKNKGEWFTWSADGTVRFWDFDAQKSFDELYCRCACVDMHSRMRPSGFVDIISYTLLAAGA